VLVGAAVRLSVLHSDRMLIGEHCASALDQRGPLRELFAALLPVQQPQISIGEPTTGGKALHQLRVQPTASIPSMEGQRERGHRGAPQPTHCP